MTILVVALLFIAGASYAVHRFRKRIERGSRARAEAKAAQARMLLEGRQRAEADYVLSRLEEEAKRPISSARDPVAIARFEEIRQVLAKTFSPSSISFPLSGPCAEVIESFRAVVGDRDLLYSESGDGRWLHCFGDRALILWVVRELFANVSQHAGEWTRISVLAEPADGVIVLTVRDDGRGLDSSVAARLYSPFTPRFGSNGVGLGLFLVRRIVEASGGTIEARSAPGQGLLHRLRLPHPPAGPYGQVGGSKSGPAVD